MRRQVGGVLVVALLLVCATSTGAWAVTENQMSKPTSTSRWIYQGYLYGKHSSDFTNAHKGVDYTLALDEAVYAAYSGIVANGTGLSEWWSDSEGWFVKLGHSGIYTYYCHLNRDPRVDPGLSPGQSVTVGQVIGKAGKTGSTGGDTVHLHFSVRDGGSAMANVRNPEKWLTYTSGTGKLRGYAWAGAWGTRAVTAANQKQIAITGATKSITGYSGSHTYYMRRFNFLDEEHWFIAEANTGEKTLTTSMVSGTGNSKTLYVEFWSGGRTTAAFDITNSINDGYEFNETRATAKTISLGTTYNSYVFNSRDDDYYKFVPAGNCTVRIDLTNLPANYDLVLLNSSGVALATSGNPGTTSDTILYAVTGGATYYIWVYGVSQVYSIYGAYQLRAEMEVLK